MSPHVTLVCGPPCAGKTTYVRAHAQPGDLVLDYDELGKARYDQAIAQLPLHQGRAWVIRCAPGPTYRAGVAALVGAQEVVLLLPEVDELMSRAGARPLPHRHRAAVRAWLQRERDDVQVGGRGVTQGDPAPRVDAWWTRA